MRRVKHNSSTCRFAFHCNTCFTRFTLNKIIIRYVNFKVRRLLDYLEDLIVDTSAQLTLITAPRMYIINNCYMIIILLT